ncbi:Uncharacterised protein [Vibrio cholerae]|uniref:Uncharacterized protein n=1 Tax=Vibrio cholerae TaxID=666 RepID=A0A655X768_VIBCL|nr:Uncharacterised protein [Vibrio cholerae]CSC07561.1 Uncharacterised protein [Vibrio cholerae]CSC45730.1 Uncharacterised protein [Vibrio cholerae]CSC46296.1 Uncharacterised protein [Vibrio cholerae]CSC69386.1 Uncharacterised protein [Vibrio cholerae]
MIERHFVANVRHIAWTSDFGGEHDFLSLTGFSQPIANKLFGFTLGLCRWRNRIHLRRIDKIHSTLESIIELLKGISLRILFTKSHGT